MHVVLETERLVLRRFTEADVDDLVALDADPEVMRFLTGGRATSRERVERDRLPQILRDYSRWSELGFFAAQGRSTGAFLGWFELRPRDDDATPARPDEADEADEAAAASPQDVELGYRLRREAWGRGLATEGARALVDHGFAVPGVGRVVAETMAVNVASRRVLEKAGLRHVRTFHPSFDDPIPGTEHGEVEYALTRDEWERGRAAGAGVAPRS